MAAFKISEDVKVGAPGVFPASEYPRNAPQAIDYAATHGKAFIADPDGTVQVVISILTEDLPPLGR